MKFFAPCLFVAFLTVTSLAQDLVTGIAPPDKADESLVRALADPSARVQQPDGTFAAWIHLSDRDLTAEQLAAALAAAERALPERTRLRRARVLAPGQSVVDVRDLPLDEAQVDAITATGARLRQRSRWLNAVSVDATPEQLAAIERLPFVEKLGLVARLSRPAPPAGAAERRLADALKTSRSESSRWSLDYGLSTAGLEQINVPPVHEMGITGAGVVIGMLDSGFRTTHDAFAGLDVIARHDFINDDDDVDFEPGDPATQHHHGTKTLSTIMGLQAGELVGPAFGASVILAKTEDVSQETPIEEDYWVAGLEWVEQLGADIVSSSLGYHDWYEFSDLDGNTAVTTIAADLAVGRGVVVVNSAGNERGGGGTGHIIAPADGDSVITVGAVNLSGDVAGFSSPGPTFDGRIKPDVAAQGVGNHVVNPDNDQSYTTADGTSFSCPLTAGVAALVLARAPGLTPMQVREALRQTADRADQPDNDTGWGILDAHAAVTYWGATITHVPLSDTEETGADYLVMAAITDRLPLDPARMVVAWSTDQTVWTEVPLVPGGGDLWQAAIPAQPAGVEVAYVIRVTDSADITTRLPLRGTDAPFVFAVGPDTTSPVVLHQPLGDQPLATWPPLVAATVTDNLGVDRVELTFDRNGGPVQGPFPLSGTGNEYVLPFPLAAGDIAVGDHIAYTITAWDRAGLPNGATSGPHAFDVIETAGLVLVIDDSGTGLRDTKFDAAKRALPAEAGRSAASEIGAWLAAAGYVVDVVAADVVEPADFDGHQAVVYSAGDNTSPLVSAALRDALRGWVLAGGRLLVEGGEVGYDALNSPGYGPFAQDVLHAVAWRGDNAGALQAVFEQAGHPLLRQPNVLPGTIAVTYAGYGDEDAVDAAADARVIMDTTGYGGAAGVLAYDDTPEPQAGQIVVWTFNARAIDPAVGAAMAENALAYLLADEAPPTAAVSGTVSVYEGDPAGVAITIADRTTVTDIGGHYELAGLYAGNHTVVAAKSGFATETREIVLDDGEVLTDVDFMLVPVVSVRVAAAPNLPIPDASGSGISSIIDVVETGGLSELSVDCNIQHTWIGDLTVRLTSPAGTTVTLHARTGANNADIIGNWPETLTVDGPGHLADFRGEDIAGPWILFVSDAAEGDTGVLNTWGLNFLVADPPTAVGDLPLVTRLVGNRPNPFNPSTTVAFDLARPGRVRLELFDLRGRLLRRLVDGALPAGRHELVWDGRDAAGRETASGVYLARLSAGGLTEMHKMTLVR